LVIYLSIISYSYKYIHIYSNGKDGDGWLDTTVL
jgi:hypothetical protein